MTEDSADGGTEGRGIDRELAVLILNACYRACRELGEMHALVQRVLPGEDGNKIKFQAGRAIAKIGRITETVFETHPDLEAYVESQINKFGRVS